MTYSFEVGPYRPPSEAYSLLIRATRYCSWNRCKFCCMYKNNKFEYRPVAEIKQDIATVKAIQDKITEMAWQAGRGGAGTQEMAASAFNSAPSESFRNVALWLYAGGETVFLQDSNSIIMRTHELSEVIRFLKETLPTVNRITSYGRSDTAARKKVEELAELHEAGLSRLHIGLETGYDPLLEYIDKGVTAARHIKGGRNVVESGISLSEYVLLGLGGKEMWREHATETARVLNEIDPDFIRIRTLTLREDMPLYDEAASGDFIRATDDDIVAEERLLIENLNCHSNYVSDHITNLFQEIEGKLPDDKEKMLAVIDSYLALSKADKINFRLGRRAGIYTRLDDMEEPHKRETVDDIVHRVTKDGNQLDEEIIYTLMQRFI